MVSRRKRILSRQRRRLPTLRKTKRGRMKRVRRMQRGKGFANDLIKGISMPFRLLGKAFGL